MLVVACLAALVNNRLRLGWLALAAAIAAKLFAVVLLPLAIVWTLRRRGKEELVRCLLVFAAAVAVALVPFLILAPHGLWVSVWGQLSRPLQIETLPGAVMRTFGNPSLIQTHGSINVAGAGAYAAGLTAMLVLTLGALWVGFARGPADKERLLRYSAACVCAVLVFGKVLSPQYLVWLIPLVPLVRGRRGLIATCLLALALLVTLVWFPERYYTFVFSGHLAWLVLVRDLVLVAILAVLALPRRATRPSSAPATPAVTARAEQIPVATLD
jgi:uncharacterized membrane protein